ncbi:MAG: hypothetical protein II458_03050 [Oscillospiraceae bacterium]|nr:hypothetical protein [Oscillospiraceae bacterium]
MASIPTNEYYKYRDMIQDICKYGTKDALERLYREIQALYGRDCEDLRTLDSFYNSKWRIL